MTSINFGALRTYLNTDGMYDTLLLVVCPLGGDFNTLLKCANVTNTVLSLTTTFYGNLTKPVRISHWHLKLALHEHCIMNTSAD